ncbi:MAG: M1 family metallopeptidase [Chlorobi bacterium]|nr:M1 family metallopeptidase [Chlorobiota bacterium]
MIRIVGISVAGLLILWSCGTSRKAQKNPEVSITVLNPSVDSVEETSSTYQETPPTLWRLIHIDADVHPVFETQDLFGEATLTLVTHFYPMDSLTLDARQFSIDTIEVINPSNIEFEYHYDGRHIRFRFNHTFQKNDTLVVKIKYKNNFSPVDTSGKAVAGDRGFYFINPIGKDPLMPPHAWTQGETEWNSWWLPLIDKPNQHLTQHICITVDDTSFLTLSNGSLQWSQINRDGSRTDCWAQDKPHAAYLIFVAIGPYKKVVDTPWNGKEVSYYLFPKYAPLAKQIFSHTREMLTYFSKLFRYPFPWDKYAQIGVYHFTAGAMENTTSVLFGASAYKTKTDLMESSIEPVVAHELVHHWFGDLVSCESWAHLTLNESFADYGEYLWNEHKYGRDSADVMREQSLNGYIWNAKMGYTRPLVFFHYEQGDDMFDAHSYNKGGAILHYLRYLSGDSAFFSSLSYYLKSREYGSAETEHLRLAFEDITGLDWRPFFQDWYYKEGHPDVKVNYLANDSFLIVSVNQQTVPKNVDPWKLKLPLIIKTTKETHIQDIIIPADTMATIHIPIEEPIEYAMLDPSYVLVGEMQHQMPVEWTKRILSDHSLPAIARRQIVKKTVFRRSATYDSSNAIQLIRLALSDPFYANRYSAVGVINKFVNKHKEVRKFFYDTLNIIAVQDKSFEVRARAVAYLPPVDKDIARQMFHKEKYPSVKVEWLSKWARSDTTNAWETLKQWTYSDTSHIVWDNALPLISKYFYNQEDAFQWLTTGLWQFAHDYWIWQWFYYYLEALARTGNEKIIKEGIDTLKRLIEIRIHPWNRQAISSYAKNFLKEIEKNLGENSQSIKEYFLNTFPFLREKVTEKENDQ